MLKREHVLMICVGILLLSCVYLLWENRRLKKNMNRHNPKPKIPEPVQEQEPEQEQEQEQEPDAMDYYVNENIPDDLKEELNNLNLEEGETNENENENSEAEAEADVLESVEADVLESVEADVLESVEADMLESVEAEAHNNEPIEMIDISEPGNIEEIIIDTKPEDDEILNLELELEKKLKASMSKYNEESLNAMNLKQLSDICRENKLKIKGKKSELIERILSM